MGGLGSGRRPRLEGRRNTVTECLMFSASNLKGRFYPGSHGTVRWTEFGELVLAVDFEVCDRDGHLMLFLEYQNAANAERIRIPIRIQKTRPGLAGQTHWFTCPLIENGIPCNRRARKLYLAPGQKYFGCRICYNLTYTCNLEAHREERHTRTLLKHALKLDPNLACSLPPLPVLPPDLPPVPDQVKNDGQSSAPNPEPRTQ